MTNTTKRLMTKIRCKFHRCLTLEGTHCGHPPDVIKCDEACIKFLVMLEKEIESLALEAGAP